MRRALLLYYIKIWLKVKYCVDINKNVKSSNGICKIYPLFIMYKFK